MVMRKRFSGFQIGFRLLKIDILVIEKVLKVFNSSILVMVFTQLVFPVLLLMVFGFRI